MKQILKVLLVYGMALFYLFAGVNHFLSPDFYLPLIPPYLPNASMINILSGLVEILFGLLLLLPQTRKWGAIGIILMLLAFIPSHWYMIELDSCISESFCFDPWVGWVRLLVVHPLLIFWAWWVSKN
jgi:uncharacterized membrane protein